MFKLNKTRIFYVLLPLLLLCSISVDAVGTLSWVENGEYIFSSLVESTIERTNTHSQVQEELTELYHEKIIGQIQYKIIEIDSIYLSYRYQYCDGDRIYNPENEYERSYAAENYASSVDNDLRAYFTFLEEKNQTVCYYVGYNPTFYPFIEPDWQTINEGYKRNFNDSRILDFVYHDMEDEMITVGDLFNDYTQSFSLMGKSTLNEGLAELNSNTTRLTLEMDLSGYQHYSYYNVSSGKTQYVPYRKALFSVEIKYEPGGILSSMKITSELEVFYGDGFLYSSQSHYEIIYGSKNFRTSLNLLYCLFGMLVLVPIVLKKRKM